MALRTLLYSFICQSQSPFTILFLFSCPIRTFRPFHFRNTFWPARGAKPSRRIIWNMDQKEQSNFEPQRIFLASPMSSAAQSSTAFDDVGQNSSSHFESSSKTNATKTAERKKYTPGLNSYLKVELDDSIIGRLYQAAGEIQATVKKWTEPDVVVDRQAGDETTLTVPNSSVADKNRNTNEIGKDGSSTRKKKRPLTVKPRSRNSLHMTFFFGGETLCELPENELVEWHQNVTTRLAESNFIPMSSMNSRETTETLPECLGSFRLRELTLFPPRRNNLVVAILEAPPEWHQLHDDIREIAQNGSSRGLKDITNRSKARWTPHITLCNVYGGTKAELQKLSRHLAGISFNDTKEDADISWTAAAKSIAMGGPVPQQTELDWKYTFCGQRAR